MICSECGKEVKNNATICPNCGASIDIPKPKVYQKWWFWCLIACVIIVIFAIFINIIFFGDVDGEYECKFVSSEYVGETFPLQLYYGDSYLLGDLFDWSSENGYYSFVNNKIYFSDSLSTIVLRKFGSMLYSDTVVCKKI